jgi:hypothetical protein
MIRIMGSIYEDQYTFVIIQRSVFFRMRYILEKLVQEKHSVCLIIFPPEYRTFYVIM